MLVGFLLTSIGSTFLSADLDASSQIPDGEVILKENYQGNSILDKIDPAVFDVKNFKK